MPRTSPSRRDFVRTVGMGALGAAIAPTLWAAQGAAKSPPNVVLIYCDEMGYADLGCYGSKLNDTPTLDQMARQGVRFTDFYVAQAVCSASRAALLTGCYPNRIGIQGALGPQARHGLNPQEMNLGNAARRAGMATALFGKWHLGRPDPLLPVNQGFDEYFGVPYSHDMWPRHPETPKGYPDLPLLEGTKILRTNPEPAELTGLVTERAVSFIDRQKDKPFFLYMPHPLPHVPLGAGAKFKGKSRNGLYGDVIAEIDDSVKQVFDALKRHRLEERTIVLFASDNGPWTTYGDHAGAAGPLREAKGTSFDGGVRVPLIAWGPGRIAEGRTCAEPTMTIDILPTLAGQWGVEMPKDRIIDGVNIWPQLSGAEVKPEKNVHEALYIYWGSGLEAVRSGKWKLHFPHNYRQHPAELATGGKPNKARQGKIGKELFNLEADPGESKDLSAENPDVVQRLEALAEKMRDDLGDSLTKRPAKNAREPGKVA